MSRLVYAIRLVLCHHTTGQGKAHILLPVRAMEWLIERRGSEKFHIAPTWDSAVPLTRRCMSGLIQAMTEPG